MKLNCDRCNRKFSEHEIEEHHCLPRFMDNPKGDGEKIYLCKTCHGVVHANIMKIIFNCLSYEQQVVAKELVNQYSKSFGGLDYGL